MRGSEAELAPINDVEPRYGMLVKLLILRRLLKDGRGGRIRTCDPLRPRQVRYQAALRPVFSTTYEHFRPVEKCQAGVL